jgi:signal transduction histidine kinase
MRKQGPLTRLAVFVPLIALTGAAVWLMGQAAYGTQMNAYVSDLFLRLRGPRAASTDGIAIVAIDDATLARYGYPLDRKLVAAALLRVCAGRPAAVGIDILFPDLSTPEADRALAEALRACPQTVLASALVREQQPGGEAPRWVDPLPTFAQLAGGVGHVYADADVDGVCRQVLLMKTDARPLPPGALPPNREAAPPRGRWAFALEILRLVAHHNGPPIEDDRSIVVGTHIIPAARDKTVSAEGGSQRPLPINFAGPEGTFPRYSFLDVFDGKVPPERFSGRAVLIGMVAEGVPDRLFTPFSASGRGMAGVEIHANLLHTLMTDSFLTPLRESSALAALAAIVTATALLLLTLRGAWLAGALALLAAAVHAAPYLLLRRWQVLAPGFTFSMAFWAPALVGGVFQYVTVWRRYVAADAASRRMRGRMEMVSHEMRSPLTAIQGSGEVISRYPLNEERRKQLGDMISRESRRLAGMVERFLDVERLEAGEISLRRETVPLRGVVERTVERIQPLAARKDIRIEAAVEGQPCALGDGELVEFALYNLLSNAVKYSPEGSKVELLARPNDALGLAFLEVKDQGAGIAAEDHSRIFERFYRTEGAQKSGQTGLGLGLSIVREIARHHGGSVMVESAPGRGSKFSLALPAAEPQATAAGTT